MMTKSKKTKLTIDRHMNLQELVGEYPKLAEVLAEDYGLHCVNCFAAGFDTLEMGAKVHGFDEKEIEEMVERLNKLAKK